MTAARPLKALSDAAPGERLADLLLAQDELLADLPNAEEVLLPGDTWRDLVALAKGTGGNPGRVWTAKRWGHTFRLALELAERPAGRTVIVSARHGVVLPDEILEPYDTAPRR